MTKEYSIAGARDNPPGGLAEGRRSFWEAYEEFRREFDPAQLGIDPDEVFGDVRDPSPGR